MLKTISNWVSEHLRVTRCHKKNWKMIKPCMDGRTMAYPTNMAHISSIMVFTRWGRKKETGGRRRWYNVFVPSVKTWKTNNVTMHKSLRRPLLTQVGTQISTSTLQRKLIFSPVLCSPIMREKELTQPPPIHQLVCADVIWGYSIFTG